MYGKSKRGKAITQLSEQVKLAFSQPQNTEHVNVFIENVNNKLFQVVTSGDHLKLSCNSRMAIFQKFHALQLESGLKTDCTTV